MAKGNSISKTFVWILLGLLIVGLAGFGATSMTGSIRTVGTVGSQAISVDEYARELQQEIRAFEAQTGQRMTMADARAFGLDQRVLQRLVAGAALDHEASEMGLSIGDANLQREILSMSAFQGIDGQFDRDTYRFALDRAGMNEADFEADLRAESARAIMQAAIAASVEMPDAMTEALVDYVGERRSFTFARLGRDALSTPAPTPSPEELRQFYEAEIARYTLPETKRITYALLSPTMLLDEVEVTDEAVQQLFDSRRDQYEQPERRLVERLVFPDEEAASSALAQIEVGGSTFESTVEARGLRLIDVDMGDVAFEDLGPAAEAVFAAETGAVVGPLPSNLGPALFRINGRLEARTTELADIEDELRDEVAGDRARRQVEQVSEEIDNLLAGGATLEELRDEMGMEVASIDWTRDTDEGVAAYAAFRLAAANVGPDDFPEVEFLEDGSVFALRLDEVLPPRPEPFEIARSRVSVDWTAAAVNDALAAEATERLETLDEVGGFNGLGLPVRVENGRTRSAFLNEVPQDFLAQVFTMEPGELRVISGDGAAYIVRLDAIDPPEETADTQALREALAVEFDTSLAQALFDVYVRDVQVRARPQLDQRALQAVETNFP
jgi:peptidyl-prolyl cis-trans isomerase D